MSEQRPQEFSGIELLARLRSGERTEAWKQFLDRYSPVIMHISGQYEFRPEERSDCYLFICEKLSENNFGRLLCFLPEGSASFRSWLSVVVANLCIDWQRHKQGRARPFKSINQLSLFDQLVFKYRFQQRASLTACLAYLQADFPNLTEPQLASAVGRINATLTPRQHWLLSTRPAQTVSLDQLETNGPLPEPVEPGPGPEETATLTQEREKLQQALARLSPRQRLAIKLRYQQDLSLKEVARLMRLGDPFQARRRIQEALLELAKYLS